MPPLTLLNANGSFLDSLYCTGFSVLIGGGKGVKKSYKYCSVLQQFTVNQKPWNGSNVDIE